MDWRKILAEIIEEQPTIKKRIAEEMEIAARTLDRWVAGTNPQSMQQIQKLALAAGRYHPDLEEALQCAFPAAFKEPFLFHVLEDISAEFYSQLIGAYATLQPNLKRYAVKNLVYLQMVRHLDHLITGFVVVFVQAVTEDKCQIDHFEVQEGAGNTAWDTQQVLSPPFALAVESTLGREILTSVPHVMQSLPLDTPDERTRCLLRREELRSLALQPVRREGALAGGLLCGSRQPDFFTNARKDLLRKYADLFALAFSDGDFYRVPIV